MAGGRDIPSHCVHIHRNSLLQCASGYAGVADGVKKMHMLLARSAMTRGMQLVAGMLSLLVMNDAKSGQQVSPDTNLVSWTSGAHSRREDELARSRLLQSPP